MDDASLRASDADREQSLAALREHMVAGRLTLEEFCARVDAALRAGGAGELAQLHDDLPDALGTSAGPRVSARPCLAMWCGAAGSGCAGGPWPPVPSAISTSISATPPWIRSGRR